MNSLSAGLQSLTSLNLYQLREEWANHYRLGAPSAMSPELLQRAIGYKIQEKALGGLNRRTQLRLSSLKSALGKGKPAASEPTSLALKSGTKLLREWRGKVHEVLALDGVPPLREWLSHYRVAGHWRTLVLYRRLD